MKIKFELSTRENENLIREELRIEDLSKRIQEQNEYVGPQNRQKPPRPILIILQSTARGLA